MTALIAGDAAAALACSTPAGLDLLGSADAVLAIDGLAAPATSPAGHRAVPAGDLASAGPAEVIALAACSASTERLAREAAERWDRPVVSCRVPVLDPPDRLRVLSVEALSCGAGVSVTARRLARAIRAGGVQCAVLRTPLANLLLADRPPSRVLREPADFSPWPVEEAEEAWPHVSSGVPVCSGTDVGALLDEAAAVAGVVVVESGSGAASPVRPEYRVLVADLSATPEDDTAAARIAAADAVVLTGADRAGDMASRAEAFIASNAREDAGLYLVDVLPAVASPQEVLDARVVVVEPWRPVVRDAGGGTVPAGAAGVLAKRFRCRVVDPRPACPPVLRETVVQNAHGHWVLPALARTPGELADLRTALDRVEADVVLWGSSAPPGLVVPGLAAHVAEVRTEVTEVAGGSLQEVVARFLPGAGQVTIRRRPRR